MELNLPPSSEPGVNGPTGLRVLVVEDHEDTARSMAALLRVLGHTVRVAFDGEAGLQQAAEFQPDVVFLDIGLPEMDGYGVAERLHELALERERLTRRRPLLVALTGWGRSEDIERSRQAGIDLHLTKPADPEQLERLLRRFESVVR